jgi:lysophospholipase L1-like esterase
MGYTKLLSFVLGVVVLASCAKSANSPETKTNFIKSPLKINSIEAYGDSVTSGFLSDTQLESKRPFSDISKLMFQLGLTLGKEENLQGFSRFELAWPKKLSELSGTTPKVTNLAVPNVGTDALVNQVALSTDESGVSAFVFIGHNDLCRTVNWSDAQVAAYYEHHIEKGVKLWEEKHQKSTLYFLPVGRIDRIYKNLWDFTWNKTDYSENRCRDIYLKYIPMCLPVADLALKGKLESVIGERTKQLNRILENVVQKNAKGSKNSYQYLSSLEQVEYQREWFAMDCFHLSSEGQKQLAEKVWQSIQPAE